MGFWTGVAGFIGGPIIKGFLKAYQSKLDAGNETDRLAADIAIADIDARIERTKARRDLGLMAMSHPVWWFAWCVFVIPVGLYHAAIYMLSTFGVPPTCPADMMLAGGDCQIFIHAVLEVPKEQAEVGRIIVRNIFFAQGTLGIAGQLVKRFAK